jgi:Zn finger protein HypA/HybF involved in hydrogenase expression
MKRYSLECNYCGYQWEENWLNVNNPPSCSKCSDKNLKIKDNSKTKIDYYAGPPPFAKEEDPGYPWSSGGD